MLRELKRLAEGYDAYGNRVDVNTQMRAQLQWREMSKLKAQTAAIHAGVEAERQRVQLEQQRTNVNNEVALRDVAIREKRLMLDAAQVAERLQIEKASVLVKALEVAVAGGVDSQQLMAAVQDLGNKLGGPASGAPLIEGPPMPLQLE